jgi:hypothetical protein
MHLCWLSSQQKQSDSNNDKCKATKETNASEKHFLTKQRVFLLSSAQKGGFTNMEYGGTQHLGLE